MSKEFDYCRGSTICPVCGRWVSYEKYIRNKGICDNCLEEIKQSKFTTDGIVNKYKEAYERLYSEEYIYPDRESVDADIDTLGELVEKEMPLPEPYIKEEK